jgi:PAS domain S-box-containing protein
MDQGAALRLVLSYAIFASLWILLSDQAVVWLFRDPAQIAMVSSVKGWLFVAVTSVLLYGLIQRYLHKIQQSLLQELAARAAGAQSHELLAAIVEGTEDAVFAKDLQGRYTLFNQAACRFVGKAKQEVLGLDDSAIFPAEQAEMLKTLDRRVVADKRVRTTEELLSTPQGQRFFLATKGPLCNARGEVFGTYGISREITAHKHMLTRLRASEERLRLAVEASDDGLWDWDICRDVAYRSPRYFEIIGRKESACPPGFSLFQSIVHAQDLPQVLANIQALREGKIEAIKADFRLAGSTEPVRWLRTRGRVVERDAQGEPLRLVGTLSDISAHKQAEEQLRQLNQDLESRVVERSHALLDLYDQAPCGYHSLAPDGTILRANQTELKLLGYAPEEYVGQRIDRFMTPESTARYHVHGDAFQGDGRVRDLELDFVCKSGQVLPLLVSIDLLRDAQGKTLETRGTVIDNSERKEQNRRILDLNKFLHGVLEVLPFGVVVLDQEQRVILRNQLFATLLDYPPEQVDQSPLLYTDLLRYNHARGDYPGQAVEEVLGRFEQLSQARQTSAFERRQANGIHLEVRGQPVSSEWTLLTFTDVSAHKAAEQTLLAARHVAEAATLAKSEFLANMSHEIRTPMNGILGLAYLLENANLAPVESAHLARKIRLTGKSLQGILNDILDFSKIEAGQLALEQARFVLGDVLESVATIMVNDPARPELELAISPPPLSLGALLGDSLRIGQILSNLVVNAIKFTQAGHVRLAVSQVETSDIGVTLLFVVSDTGIGISAAALAEIFKPFSQADASTTRRYGGTGLGLAISRRLVEMMGSRLQVKSLEGAGSEFWFALRLPWAPRETASAPGLDSLEVLIADDSPISRDALHATALGLGWSASVVDGGQAAVQHVLARQQQQAQPQVLLLDWHMPDLDGLGVARAVNQALAGTQGPIVILATAYSREELLAQPDSQLVDAVLAKPVTPSSLHEAVKAALEKRHGRPAVPAQASRPRLEGVRLLVVDDSEINLEIAQLIFAGEGAQVVSASNGQEALDWLQAHPLDVDLVLMDVQMPVMDGMRATQLIRAIPALAQLPVVALTADAFKSNLDQALAAGMNEHLTKPMDVERAIAVIQKLTGRGLDQRSVSQAGAGANALREAEHLPALSLRRGLSIWRDAGVYQQYLRKFVRDYSDFDADFRPMSLADQQALAHKLRGAAGNLALDQVAAAAADLDERLKLNQHPGDALQRVQQAINQASTAIVHYAAAQAPPPQAPRGPLEQGLPARLLEQALQILGTDTPEGMEPVLGALEGLLPASQVAPLRHAVESFDFRSAEAAVLALQRSLEARP